MLNPQFDFLFCTCDLTPNVCDENCCCDKSCSEEYFEGLPDNAVCKPRRDPVRTVYEKTIDAWTCNDIYGIARKSDYAWFPILCIHVIDHIVYNLKYSF